MGHRQVSHTADVRIEAWALTREACISEAVAGVVSSFADLSAAEPGGEHQLRVGPGADDELLLAVLDEVIFQLDATGRVPVATELTPVDRSLDVRMRMADVASARPVGAVPKAVSWHDLRCERRQDGWWCTATVDV